MKGGQRKVGACVELGACVVAGAWVVVGAWVVLGACVVAGAWVVAGACVVEPAEQGGLDSSPNLLMAVMYSRCAFLQSISAVPATTPSME